MVNTKLVAVVVIAIVAIAAVVAVVDGSEVEAIL